MEQYISKLAVLTEVKKFMYSANLEADIASTGECFNEKAAEWLKEQNEMIGVSFREDFLERFQNYMKGE